MEALASKRWDLLGALGWAGLGCSALRQVGLRCAGLGCAVLGWAELALEPRRPDSNTTWSTHRRPPPAPAGNAVTVPVARWLGERLANPYNVRARLRGCPRAVQAVAAAPPGAAALPGPKRGLTRLCCKTCRLPIYSPRLAIYAPHPPPAKTCR